MVPRSEFDSGGIIYKIVFEGMKRSITQNEAIMKIALGKLTTKENEFLEVNLDDELYKLKANKEYLRKYLNYFGLSPQTRKFITIRDQFLKDFNDPKRDQMFLVDRETRSKAIMEKQGITRVSKSKRKPKMVKSEIIDTTIFPNLQGIYGLFEDLKNYFAYTGVYVSDNLIRKLLLAVERDVPIVLYGEPGDGKSKTIKTFFQWMTLAEPLRDVQIFRSKERVTIEGGNFARTTVDQKKKKIGFAWKSINIDPAVNPGTLFGAYAPESIGGGAESRENRVVDWGVISECIMEGKYLMMDELNRGENEVLARLNGALAEPYSYEVREANTMFLIKDPDSDDPKRKRSNFIICASINIGDIGNFSMSFAFKRRWKIIEIHYTPDEIRNLMNLIYSRFQSTEGPYLEISTDKHKREDEEIKALYLSVTQGGNSIRFYDKCCESVSTISLQIYKITHDWKDVDKLIQFGCGIAHIDAIFHDISLFLQDLLLRENGSRQANFIRERTFSDRITAIVNEALMENIVMQVVDENDLYKLNEVKGKVKGLVDLVSAAVKGIFTEIGSNYFESKDSRGNYPLLLDKTDPTKSSKVSQLIAKVFKFDSSIKFVRGSFNLET
jgi:MoxR-like ATPase